MSDSPIDLVCWDFGDTLVHERFMRRNPPGVPEWEEVYDELSMDPAFDEPWMLGDANMTDLIPRLAARLPMTNAAIARHLRHNWHDIDWFPDAREWIHKLNGRRLQAIVTVNPFEISGILTACGLDPVVDVVVNSAEIRSLSKVAMTEHARMLLGLDAGLGSSILIDNRVDNCEEFTAAGGVAIHFTPETFGTDAEQLLAPLL
ncbi:MAG: hypothetical protein AAF548_00895 [Actinomycetota bacterium]